MTGVLAGSELAVSSHLIGRAVLRACCEVLAAERIRVMPLKGLWLQELVYGDALERAISDVDVLVEPGRYRAAQRALGRAGWQRRGVNVSEVVYESPTHPLPLDLHARLYTRGVFRMAPAALFARGTVDSARFGVEVIMPDPRDVLAHLIGHALKGGTAWSGEGTELRDIPRLAAVLQLSAADAARHLERVGLARAARLVLPLTAAHDITGFGAAVLSALSPDPLGVALARAAEQLPRVRPLPTLLGFALDSSLWRGSYAFGLRTLDKVVEVVGARR